MFKKILKLSENMMQNPGQGYPPIVGNISPPGSSPYPSQAPYIPPPYPNQASGPPPIGFVDGPQSSHYQPPSMPVGGGFPIAPPGSGYPPSPAYPPGPGYSQGPPAPGYPHGPPGSGYPPAPGYPQAPPAPGYPQAPTGSGYPPTPGYPQAPPGSGYPPIPPGQGYPSGPPGSGYPPGPPNNYPPANQGYPTAPTGYPSTVVPSNPTIRPMHPFNAIEDAKRLYKAMKGIGTDERTLIDVLCRRTWPQRQEIVMAYKSAHGKDLQHNIESETSGDFRDVLVALLKTPMAYEAENLRHSVAGVGTKEDLLIDVVCTKSNVEMVELKNAYKQIYNRNLEEDVRDDVSGYFKRLLVSLMAANRQENQPADYNRAVQLARELYEAGERRLGTNEMVFNRIFATESYAQLRLVFDEYQKLTRHPIENAVKSEMSSSVEQAYLTIIQFARSPAGFYAQRLQESMRGMGTRDKHLIRICVTRSEIDMQDIKIEFQRRFGKTLESWIRSDCSGDYQRALLCLVGDPRWKS